MLLAGEEERVIRGDEKHRTDGDLRPLVSPPWTPHILRVIDVCEEQYRGEIVPKRGEKHRRKVQQTSADRDERRSPNDTEGEKQASVPISVHEPGVIRTLA